MKKMLFAFVAAVMMMTMLMSSAFAAHVHVWPDEWDWEVMPTCTTPGRQVRACDSNVCSSHQRRTVAPIPHDFLPATCEEPATCRFGCNTTDGAALGHSYAAATCVAPKTCVRCDATTGDLGQHLFAPATCTKKSTCRICGVSIGSTLPHTYVDGRCTVCGQYETISLGE
ncbi:MAG: hypothetical protein J6M20_04335 [Clostridia bacterium]|nr:hypothetical protein [Clostridia bacterium]